MSASETPIDGRSLVLILAPIMLSVFVVFVLTGAALPALPLHVSQNFGYGAFVVGLISGAQFAASLISRFAAGSYADTNGPKRSVVIGLLMTTGVGMLYLASLAFENQANISVGILLLGRALMGAAESFVITAAQSWSLSLSGPANGGRVISWMGIALYVGLAAGAPIGSLLFEEYGFLAIGIVTVVVPLTSLPLVLAVASAPPGRRMGIPMLEVFKAVSLPGLGLSLASLGYGAMTAFAVLYFAQRGWEPAWLSFTAFATAFIVTRFVLGGLPDRIGGARVALIFAVIQGAGMLLLWLSPNAPIAFVGAAMVGIGYSLVYPGLGIEAVRRAPPHAKGSAMGAYTAFLDLTLGVLTPLLGLVAGLTGLGSIFLIGAALTLATVPVAIAVSKKG